MVLEIIQSRNIASSVFRGLSAVTARSFGAHPPNYCSRSKDIESYMRWQEPDGMEEGASMLDHLLR